MEHISYIGTYGYGLGIYSIGINYLMSKEELDFYSNIWWWKDNIPKNKNKEHKCSYWIDHDDTYYGLLYSIDYDNNEFGRFAALVVKGQHTIEEIETIINGNYFLKKEFDVKRRFPDKDGKTA